MKQLEHHNPFQEFLSSVVFFLLFIFGLLIFTGCSYKDPYLIYVKPQYPILMKYDKPEPIKLHVKNKGDQVCIREWDNSCLPKKSFEELVTYINRLKKVILMYENEIDVYNSFAQKNQK